MIMNIMTEMTKSKQWQDRIAGILILVLFAAAYSGITELGFISFDDPVYVYENPKVYQPFSWDSLKWAFSTFEAGNWHPVTWLTHMGAYALFGMNPAGHHIVNLLFHLGNTLLIYHLFRNWTGAYARAFLIAMLFGLHPLLMESVAWISERKDVLSVFFFLLMLVSYTLYAETKMKRHYAAAFFLLVLGLMSKSMLVTAPFVLLLIDYWPLNRFKAWGDDNETHKKKYPAATIASSIFEKIPFFVVIILFCIITVISQAHVGAMQNVEKIPLWARLVNAPIACGHYISHLIYPADLSVFYIHPKTGVSIVRGAAWLCALIALSVSAYLLRKKKPYAFTGWFWFVGTLVPVIGIVQVGSQAYANRYAYLPSIGFFVLVSWGAWELFKKLNMRKGFAAGIIVLAAMIVPATRSELKNWQNDFTIYAQALKNSDENALVENNLGVLYLNNKEYDKAMLHLKKGLELAPNDSESHKNLAILYYKLDDEKNGEMHFEKAISLKPDDAGAYVQYANLLLKYGKKAKAILFLSKGIEFMGDNPKDINNAGTAFWALDEKEKALTYFKKAYEICRHCDSYHINYAKALYITGDIKGAVSELKKIKANMDAEILLEAILKEIK